jgi:hypothetical protein
MICQALANWQWPYDGIMLLPMAVGAVIALILLAMGKRRAGAIAIIFFLGLTGGGMVFGFDSEDTGRQYYSMNLKVVQDQLAELADRLRSYKARHERYPTNDEHLGVLDDFQLRFPLPVRPVEDERRNPSGIRWMGDWYIQDTIARLLRQTVGRPLARQQEEAESLCLTADLPGIEIAMGKRDTILVFRDGMACSPWGIPYMYENRNGLAASAFADSPATHPDGRYSLKVDDGIYLWCISAKGPAGELAALEARKSIRQVAGWVMIALFVAGLLWLTFRIYPGLGCAGWLAMLISLPAGAVMTTVGTMCYVMIPFFSRRDPATIAAQQELLAKYRDAGVITDATYRRAIAAADPSPPVSQPVTPPATDQTTQPGEGR